MRPQPSEEEIQFILDAIADYLTVQVGVGVHRPRWGWECTVPGGDGSAQS